MQDLFKMRRCKHATTQGKLLTASEPIRFPNDVTLSKAEESRP